MAEDTLSSNSNIIEEDPFNEDKVRLENFFGAIPTPPGRPTCGESAFEYNLAYIWQGKNMLKILQDIKFGSGKTTLAKKLARAWKCEIINGSEIMNQGIELQTELGANAQDILLRGEAIPEEVSAKVLLDKISSPEVAHHGECND
ncbi:Adenylate kinase [Desmophyllum pertusum]|uniref:Adenylate kinase n=1 Tax=Desmophyllum pertusum TaxID=174260 RepID=A0A9W9YR84_9CNID|nr:Adenylate kinase [Desmophyllum pertusum]